MMNKLFLLGVFFTVGTCTLLLSENSEHLWDIDSETPDFYSEGVRDALGGKTDDTDFIDTDTDEEEWDLDLPPTDTPEETPNEESSSLRKSMSQYFISESVDGTWELPPTEPSPNFSPFEDTPVAPPTDELIDILEEPIAPTSSQDLDTVPEPDTPPDIMDEEPQSPLSEASLKRTSPLHAVPIARSRPTHSNASNEIAEGEPIDGGIISGENREETVPLSTGQLKTPPKTILINFNNVSVIEYIRFVSRITNKNFLFNQDELQFTVTIISEEPATLDNVITALIQELQIHGFSLIERENTFIIHQNPNIRNVPKVNVNGIPSGSSQGSEIITQVFKLNTLDPTKAATIAQPLLSEQALIATSEETQHIIITDLVNNIEQIVTLFKSLDAPNSGLVIGQYVVRNSSMTDLITLAKEIMEPIAQQQPLTVVPHPTAQSIFIVSSPFLVERTISVLQHLDSTQGTTRIYNLDDLQFEKTTPQKGPQAPEGLPDQIPDRAPEGHWELTPEGDRVFRPGLLTNPRDQPAGEWQLDAQGNWYFVPSDVINLYPGQGLRRTGVPIEQGEAPEGSWVQDENGNWVFRLNPGEGLQPKRLRRRPKVEEDLPLGHIERTKFYLHKLQYRKGGDIVDALQGIGDSLQVQETANTDLVATIQSAQWLEASNALVFTGTESSLEKMKELIDEIDSPLRQVFIEMLILDTSLEDSLNYGVAWGTRSGGGSTSTAQAFTGTGAPLVGALATGIINAAGTVVTPNAGSLIGGTGYHMGVIGQRLTHGGTQFATMGAFVEAVHTRKSSNILLNPKIVTEDNKVAEIFVGENIPYLTQSVTNDQGNVVTGNFEYRDVGTTLKVTPLIGHGQLITLEIEEEVSEAVEGSEVSTGTSGTTSGPTTRLNRTNATIHIPDGYFVILSGMVRDLKTIEKNQVPCLGGIPFIGAANKFRDNTTKKRNLMIFIRPQIIDTEEQFNKLTRQQQETMKQKNRMKKNWKYEVDEALEFMNLKGSCCDDCR